MPEGQEIIGEGQGCTQQPASCCFKKFFKLIESPVLMVLFGHR